MKSLSRVRLSDPMDCSPPGSSIHGIFQARVLEWGAIAFSDNGYNQSLNFSHSSESKSPLNCKVIQPVHPKGDQSWIFIGRNDAEAETPVLWPPDAKNWLIWKDPDAEKDWRQEEKGTTEDEMVGWHQWLNGQSSSKLPELVMDREARRAAVHGVSKSRTRLSNWTELKWKCSGILLWF